MLKVDPRYTDDIALRLEYFNRSSRSSSMPHGRRKPPRRRVVAPRTPEVQKLKASTADEVRSFAGQARSVMLGDEQRLRAIQNEDGSWGFNPGFRRPGTGDWARDPQDKFVTLRARITGLTAAGRGLDDPAVSKAVTALLALQEPSGRWNRNAITGFVTTAYVLNALSRLFPVQNLKPARAQFAPKPGESLLAVIKRVQALALNADPKHADLMAQAAVHSSPLVRYWAYIGLGATHTQAGVRAIMAESVIPPNRFGMRQRGRSE